MEQINKLIRDRLTLEESNIDSKRNNIINSVSYESIIPQTTKQPKIINYYKYSELINKSNPIKNPNLNENPKNNYRRQLIISKLIISELQESNSKILLEKQQIESQLNEALESIKSLHSDYISLTEKFNLVNKSINIEQNNNISNNNNNFNDNEVANLERKIKEIEEEKKILQIKNEELDQKLSNSNELNKMQEEKYNYKILLLTKKLEKQEYEIKEQNNKLLDNYDKIKYEEENKRLKEENLSLRQENIELSSKYSEDKKKLYLDLEKYKSKINLLESQNYNITTELKEKAILLEKEMRINEQYNTLDKHFNNSLQEKNISYNTLNDQYIKLFKEFNEYKSKNEKEKEEFENKYNKLNNDYTKLNNLQEEYKHKINRLNNKIKELKENKKNKDYKNNFDNNFDSDRDISFKYNDKLQKNKSISFNNIDNDIKSSKSFEVENNKKNNNNNILALEEKIYFLTKQKEYILSLLLKVTPNKKLIQQIIDLNLEILQLERQKESIVDKIKENPNLNNILPKINEQIKKFKNHLLSLEEELISVDFGSSRIIDNSISVHSIQM